MPSTFDAELARWQARRPVAAVGGDWRYWVRKWLARREQPLSLAVTVGGVLWAALMIAGSWTADLAVGSGRFW